MRIVLYYMCSILIGRNWIYFVGPWAFVSTSFITTLIDSFYIIAFILTLILVFGFAGEIS